MRVSEFDYHLPPELIARYPAPERDASRLMLLNRATGAVSEELFSHLAQHLLPGDLLVMNDTRVMPSRLFGCKETGGRVEIFLVRRLDGEGEEWECLLRSSKRMREGQTVLLTGGMVASVNTHITPETWLVSFSGNEAFQEWLDREGHMPLPPYLQRDDEVSDRERYQTVYSRVPGAVAAPTAGLHFTGELLSRLRHQGVQIAYLTLHTGLGTFQPVRVEQVEDHRIHTERYSIPGETAAAVRATRERGGRVIAVGTTTTRTLEFAADDRGMVAAGEGEADIFIYPGYRFRVVDALITNFHLPESTLLMLVAAFAGRDNVLSAYGEAVRRGFRFYSYGDAMLIA